MDTTRVYMPEGRVAHLLDAGLASPNSCDESLCGKRTADGFWYGTGSQAEYDEAERLPVCRACCHRAAPDG
jgi:hypothetical protein